ncbi:MAG: phosphoadenosine phosphosulfate reductase [Candidatus Hydrothermia bacterium]
MRFLRDCEKALGKKIEILQSPYKSVSRVIQQFRYINGVAGATCTRILKKRVRNEWEYGKTDLTYIWGYDISERHRAERLQETFPEHKHVFPLIERGLSKEDCHGLCSSLGIKRPKMYDMGYRNNNCIGCVKGGMGYWNKIRKDFPEVFAERARLEREIGASCINGVYLDELEPDRGKIEDEIMEECSIFCQMILTE